jgi:probable phosphoglycerate mutase
MTSKQIYLIRHGETEWSKSGQHTGLTDLPLTENGINQAKHLGKRLERVTFDHVFTSPLKRAYDTCCLCGLKSQTKITDALLEWNYGDYEGKKTAEIHQTHPGWNIFDHGAPNGESTAEITKRADDFLKKLESLMGTIAVFSSGHFSRALTVRFLGFPLLEGRHFMLSTASLSILSYEHHVPALQLWNDISHHSQ